MNFSALPDRIFLQIFRQLPLKDQIRSGRVNSAFRRMSTMAIREMTTLEISENALGDRFTTWTLSRLLKKKLRAGNLRRIVICSFGMPDHVTDYCYVLGKYEYPNLELFHYEALLNWMRDENGYTEEGLRSLTGRMPNLKTFGFNMNAESPAVLEEFLASVPNLEELKIHFNERSSPFTFSKRQSTMDAFWRLKRLLVLSVDDFFYSLQQAMLHHFPVDDSNKSVIMRMAESFPGLRMLTLPAKRITKADVDALSTLRVLRILRLRGDDAVVKNGRQKRDTTGSAAGIGALLSSTKCVSSSSLEMLVFMSDGYLLAHNVLAQLFHSWPQLAHLVLWDLEPFETEDRAVAVVASFGGLLGAGGGGGTTRPPKEIRVTFMNNIMRRPTRRVTSGEYNNNVIWRSNAVQEALEKLKREEGLEVKCRWPELDNRSIAMKTDQ